MQTNWKVWILSIVAAVGGANIIGVNEPVRAQEVTYTIGSAQLSSGWDVTGGSIEYSNGGIEGGSLSVEDVADSEQYNIPFMLYSSAVDGQVYFYSATAGPYIASLGFNSLLTGQEGQEVQVSYTLTDLYDESSLEVIGNGEVEAEVASTPEPTSSMATVIAVTLGVVLSGKRRKLSAREKKRTAQER